uniref:RRM domain-containing protein n=1 Tax=Romanomermis culicivorax TaxID=13658 RepID=A0A915IK12_ROMCU
MNEEVIQEPIVAADSQETKNLLNENNADNAAPYNPACPTSNGVAADSLTSPIDVAAQQQNENSAPAAAVVERPPPTPQDVFSSSNDSSMTYFQQTGEVMVGPGGVKEAIVLGLGLPKLRREQEDNLARAKRYALEQSIKHVLLKQTVAHQQQQQKNAMYSQALSLMSRVYVGSVSFELKEETIRGAFSPFGPIKSINMSFDPATGHHKGFAFVEFELPEAASLAQEQMNGLLMGGRNIKVGRPSNMPQAQPIVDTIMSDARKCNRVYVSSIHLDLSENDVKSVFEAFGRVTSIEMPKNPFSTKHRGYAYLEYETEKSAIDAVSSMNLFDLGGQYLRVGRIQPPAPAISNIPAQNLPGIVGGPVFSVPPPGLAIPQPPVAVLPPAIVMPQLFSTPPPPPSNGFAPVQAQKLLQNAQLTEQQKKLIEMEAGQTLAAQEDIKIKGNEARNILMHKLMRRIESCVLVLRNMVGVEDVDENLQEEVEEECSNFGRVEQVVIYQEKQYDADDAPVLVKIFVKYSLSQEAETAKNKMDGRYFAGRVIKADIYDQNLFEHNDLSQ